MKKFTRIVLLACCLLVPATAWAKGYPTLTPARRPEDVGFSSKKLDALDNAIREDINKGFPGVGYIIIRDNKIVRQAAFGYAKKYDGPMLTENTEPMTTSTLFDLASNTKMYATNFALQKLVSEGKISVGDLVAKFIPQFRDGPNDAIKGKDRLTLQDLMHHCAGFPADPEYHNKSVAGPLFSQDKATTLEMICKTPLQYAPGEKHIYSDVDYMILGFVVEKVTGMPLDRYVETQIYKPLGLHDTMFNPLDKGIPKTRCAATELNGNTRDGAISFPNVRTYTLQGEVHDEKAFYSMGGVSGHAGLFSTTSDLAVLLQVMLNDGGYGHTKVFSAKTEKLFLTPSPTDPTYGLGWRLNKNDTMTSTFGTKAGKKTFGHTGWTGTLTVLDPDHKMGIVLLTNARHAPIATPQQTPNRFSDDNLNLRNYGWFVDQVYGAMTKR